MSIAKILFDGIGWGEFSHIILFLNLNELWILGQCNKFAFITFLKEKSFRRSENFKNLVLDNFRRDELGYLPFWAYNDHDKVLLTSYPRSGNSFVRKVLEEMTGIITGSDSRPNRPLTGQLVEYGYRGEGITDNSVWIVKSHYPERTGYMRVFAQRVLVVVRNPFDSIESYFNMAMTSSHNRTLSSQAFETLRSIWCEFVPNESKVWFDFYSFWLRRSEEVPVLFVRYEDLLTDAQAQKRRMDRFISEGRPPRKYLHFLKQRKLSSAAVASSRRSNSSDRDGNKIAPCKGYTPRSGSIGKGLARMTATDISAVVEITGPLLDRLGYKVTDSGIEVGPFECQLLIDSSSSSSSSSSNINSSSSGGGSTSSITISTDKFSVRAETDKFGRAISDLRQSLTAMDTKPFAVVE